MPRGNRKFKCDCCKRFFPKSKKGYYVIKYKGEELVLCEDCKRRYDEGYLNKFLKELQFPIETYFKVSNDEKCDFCGKFYHPDKIKMFDYAGKKICQFCKNEKENDMKKD